MWEKKKKTFKRKGELNCNVHCAIHSVLNLWNQTRNTTFACSVFALNCWDQCGRDKKQRRAFLAGVNWKSLRELQRGESLQNKICRKNSIFKNLFLYCRGGARNFGLEGPSYDVNILVTNLYTHMYIN